MIIIPLKFCINCKKQFKYKGSKLCPECKKEDELDFQKVREYLKENPSAVLIDISEDTGVSQKRIMRYIRENRLVMSEGLEKSKFCEKCGRPVAGGRFCKKCVSDINSIINQTLAEESKKTKGMHIDELKK